MLTRRPATTRSLPDGLLPELIRNTGVTHDFQLDSVDQNGDFEGTETINGEEYEVTGTLHSDGSVDATMYDGAGNEELVVHDNPDGSGGAETPDGHGEQWNAADQTTDEW